MNKVRTFGWLAALVMAVALIIGCSNPTAYRPGGGGTDTDTFTVLVDGNEVETALNPDYNTVLDEDGNIVITRNQWTYGAYSGYYFYGEIGFSTPVDISALSLFVIEWDADLVDTEATITIGLGFTEDGWVNITQNVAPGQSTFRIDGSEIEATSQMLAVIGINIHSDYIDAIAPGSTLTISAISLKREILPVQTVTITGYGVLGDDFRYRTLNLPLGYYVVLDAIIYPPNTATRVATWAAYSGVPAVAIWDASTRTLTAYAQGTAVITATAEGIEGRLTVTVLGADAPLNTAALEAAIETAEQQLARVYPYNNAGDVVIAPSAAGIYIDQLWVTQEMFDALEKAFNAAENIMDGAPGEFNQLDVDGALGVLNEAISGFTPQPGAFDPNVEPLIIFANGSIAVEGGVSEGGTEIQDNNIVLPQGWGRVWLWPHIDISGHSYFVMEWHSTSPDNRTFGIFLTGPGGTPYQGLSSGSVAPGRISVSLGNLPTGISQHLNQINLSSTPGSSWSISAIRFE